MELEKRVYKSSEAQRAANRRYREKVKETEEYKKKKMHGLEIMQLIIKKSLIITNVNITVKNTKKRNKNI